MLNNNKTLIVLFFLFGINFFLFAQDDGPILNEEAIIIEATTQSINDIWNQDVTNTYQKEEYPKINVEPLTLSLQNIPIQVMNHISTPYVFIPDSTSYRSLEFSSKPKWITPDDTLKIEHAKIDPQSVQSYDAQVKWMTYCSWITRNNLQRLTKLQDIDSVKWFDGKGILIGDAIDIIEQWVKANIFKEVYLDDGSIKKYLNRVYRHTKATIFDIYIHHTKFENRFFAGHRVTAFLGTDNEWYILDPVMTHHQNAVPLEEYFSSYGNIDQDRIYILKTWYAPVWYQVEPYPLFAVKYFHELEPLIESEDIIITTGTTFTKVAFNTDIRFLAEFTFIDIAAGTVMTVAWNIDDDFFIQSIDFWWDYSHTLWLRKLWSENMKIYYSQPVKITFLTDIEDGMVFTPIQLDDDTRLKNSITSNKYARCNDTWQKLDQQDTNSLFIIENQKASFYSCDGGPVSIIPWFNMLFDEIIDGNSPFHSDTYDGVSYQWQDNNAHNGIVRAWDMLVYNLTLQGSKFIHNDIVLDIQISASNIEDIMAFNIPTQCVKEKSYVNTSKKILHCVLDKLSLQEESHLQIPVTLSRESKNNNRISLITATTINDTVLYSKSKETVITNFFDNRKLNVMTETVEEWKNKIIRDMKSIIVPIQTP